jgi:hypothetical protein
LPKEDHREAEAAAAVDAAAGMDFNRVEAGMDAKVEAGNLFSSATANLVDGEHDDQLLDLVADLDSALESLEPVAEPLLSLLMISQKLS